MGRRLIGASGSQVHGAAQDRVVFGRLRGVGLHHSRPWYELLLSLWHGITPVQDAGDVVKATASIVGNSGWPERLALYFVPGASRAAQLTPLGRCRAQG
jgi:hypothetical protein